MDITDYIRVIRRNWVAVALIVLLGGALGATTHALREETYAASAEVLVATTAAGDSAAELAQANNYTAQRLPTHASLISSQSAIERIASAVPSVSESGIRARVTARVKTGTSVIVVSAIGASPDDAVSLASASTDALVDEIEALENANASSGQGPVRTEIIRTAEPPTEPIGPGLHVYAAIGALAAFFLGLLFCVMRERLQRRVQGVRSVEEVSDAAVLGIATGAPPSARSSDHDRVPDLAAIVTNLQYTALAGESRRVVFAAPRGSEGLVRVLDGIARGLAYAGETALVVDADFGRDQRSRASRGLTDLIVGEASVTDVIQHTESDRVFFLPVGKNADSPAEIVRTRTMKSVLNELSREFDWVLFATAGVLDASDAGVLATMAGRSVVVARVGRTRKRDLAQSTAMLDFPDAPLAGVLLVPEKEKQRRAEVPWRDSSQHNRKQGKVVS